MNKNTDTPTNLSMNTKLSPALFLDWDGTIRKSKTGEFIKDENDIELIQGIEKIIWHYRNAGYLIIGISNQGGVAFGHKRPSHIEREMDATLRLFKINPFHVVKMCYHMEGGSIEPFNHKSLLRKPYIGMLALAEFEAWQQGYMIDYKNSLFVGDREEDEECAKNAGIAYKHISQLLSEPITFEVPTKLPETLEEAIEYFYPRFEGMDSHFSKSQGDFAAFCHSQLSGGIGMKIRNELGFWTKDTAIYHHMVNVQRINHPDSMSDLIIRFIYDKYHTPKQDK